MWLNKKQASEKLGVCKRTFDRLRAEGKISTYVITERTLRFDSEELDAYMRNTKATS